MKVLLLDAAFSAVPIHEYLTDIGCDVWTMGNRAEDPLALAYRENWICANYGDAALVQSCVKEHGFGAVIPGCTDVSMASFVQLKQQASYWLSPETNDILNNKPLFRRLCRDLDVPAPRAVDIRSLPKSGRFICKPADSFSGRGVTIFDAADTKAVDVAVRSAMAHSPRGEIICETFIEGELHSYTAFLNAGAVQRAFIVREGSRYNPFAVDTSHLCDDYDSRKLLALRAAIEKISAHLDLCDGLLHTQFIDSGDGIAIIEMTRRCPGDLYARLIEYSTGYHYAGEFASYFLGRRVEVPRFQRRYVLRHTIKQMGQERFFGLEIDLPGVFKIVPVVRNGEALDPKIATRVGLAFAEAADYENLRRLYAATINR
ncbi:MAG: acetyl-CoA carboxylase biotin carboxylase subunit family protein [Acetobacteraceae bacterium]